MTLGSLFESLFVAPAIAFALVACERKESTDEATPPPAPPSASVTIQTAPAPSASSAPSASAAPPSIVALPGFPALDLACRKDTDCSKVNVGDDCCAQCEPRVCNKASAAKVTAICAAASDAGKLAACGARACSYFFGAPRCVDGRCTVK